MAVGAYSNVRESYSLVCELKLSPRQDREDGVGLDLDLPGGQGIRQVEVLPAGRQLSW